MDRTCSNGHTYSGERCDKCRKVENARYYQKVKESPELYQKMLDKHLRWRQKMRSNPDGRRLLDVRSLISYERLTIERGLKRREEWLAKKERKLIALIKERDELVDKLKKKNGN